MIRFSRQPSPISIALYNAAGKQVMRQTVEKGLSQAALDTRDVTPGYYSVRLNSKQGIRALPVLIIN
jgi:hypothetical protein